MKNIKPTRWHYRLLLSWHNGRASRVPANLCPYVRALLGVLLLFSVMAFVATMMVVSFVLLWTAVFLGWPITDDTPFDAFYAIGFAVSVGLVIGVLMLAGKFAWRGTKHVWHAARGTPNNSEPSLVVEYVRAKHDKLCPSLTFKDKDKD